MPLDPLERRNCLPKINFTWIERNAITLIVLLLLATMWAAYGFTHAAKALGNNGAKKVITSINTFFSEKPGLGGGLLGGGHVVLLAIAFFIDRYRNKNAKAGIEAQSKPTAPPESGSRKGSANNQSANAESPPEAKKGNTLAPNGESWEDFEKHFRYQDPWNRNRATPVSLNDVSWIRDYKYSSSMYLYHVDDKVLFEIDNRYQDPNIPSIVYPKKEQSDGKLSLRSNNGSEVNTDQWKFFFSVNRGAGTKFFITDTVFLHSEYDEELCWRGTRNEAYLCNPVLLESRPALVNAPLRPEWVAKQAKGLALDFGDCADQEVLRHVDTTDITDQAEIARRLAKLSKPASHKEQNAPPASDILCEEPVMSQIPLTHSEQSVMTIHNHEWYMLMITEEELQKMIQGKSVATDAGPEDPLRADCVDTNNEVVLANQEIIHLMPTSGRYKGGPFFLDQNSSKWELHLCCRQGTKNTIRIIHERVRGGNPAQLYVRPSTTGDKQYVVAWPKP